MIDVLNNISNQQEKEMETILAYWKSNTPVFKQPVDENARDQILSRTTQQAAMSNVEKNASEETISMKLQTIEDRFSKECLSTKRDPPYW